MKVIVSHIFLNAMFPFIKLLYHGTILRNAIKVVKKTNVFCILIYYNDMTCWRSFIAIKIKLLGLSAFKRNLLYRL